MDKLLKKRIKNRVILVLWFLYFIVGAFITYLLIVEINAGSDIWANHMLYLTGPVKMIVAVFWFVQKLQEVSPVRKSEKADDV